jgi:hypothetical protein
MIFVPRAKTLQLFVYLDVGGGIWDRAGKTERNLGLVPRDPTKDLSLQVVLGGARNSRFRVGAHSARSNRPIWARSLSLKTRRRTPSWGLYQSDPSGSGTVTFPLSYFGSAKRRSRV